MLFMVIVNSESHCIIKIDYTIFKSRLRSENEPKPISNNNKKTKPKNKKERGKRKERFVWVNAVLSLNCLLFVPWVRRNKLCMNTSDTF